MVESEESAKMAAKEASKQFGKLEARIKDLEHECYRKKQLALQAVAARGEIKRHLDDAIAANEGIKAEKA